MQNVENIYLIQNNKQWINSRIMEYYGDGEYFNKKSKFGLASKR